MGKWGAVGFALLGLYVLCFVVVLGLGHRYLTSRSAPARSAASPTAPPKVPSPADTPASQPWPPQSPNEYGGQMPDMTAVARAMGFVVYPGARGGGGSWGGSGAGLDGSIHFSAFAPYQSVVDFYRETYRPANPTVRAVNTPVETKTLLVWQDREAGYAVAVTHGGVMFMATRSAMVTGITLSRIGLPMKLAPSKSPGAEAARGIEPAKLGLTMYPRARVSYSGWARGEHDKVAVARLEVDASGKSVADFYRGIAQNNWPDGGGSSTSGSDTTSFSTSWSAGEDRCAVAMLHPASHLPTIVWLERLTQ